MTLFVQMFRFTSEPFYFAKAEEGNTKEMFANVMKYFVIAGLIIFLIVTFYMDRFKHIL